MENIEKKSDLIPKYTLNVYLLPVSFCFVFLHGAKNFLKFPYLRNVLSLLPSSLLQKTPNIHLPDLVEPITSCVPAVIYFVGQCNC